MTLRKISFFVLSLMFSFLSCKKDDPTDEEVVIRDREEQQALDIAAIEDYLDTHYYNAGAFLNNPDPSISDLIITDEKVDDSYVKLLDAVGAPKETEFAEITYKYYVLSINQGGGTNSPTFADQVSVLYEGFLMNDDETVFDSAVNPVPFNLVGNGTDVSGVIVGWRKVLPEFNVAESFVSNGDGTDNFINPGVGVMFLPSGLAYFSSSPSTSIPAYSPLAFKFELLGMVEIDFDNDGIPNYLEELNGDGEYTVVADATVSDDDTDGDRLPNYVDADDDGDRIPTKDEIEISTINKPTLDEVKNVSLQSKQKLLNNIVKEADGTFTGTILTFKDEDNDGKPDYLDAN